MDRVLAARQRLDQVASVARGAREAGPPCSECRFRKPFGYCGHPAYAEATFDPSAGNYAERFITPTADARDENGGLCGPEGLLFESSNQIIVAASKLMTETIRIAARIIVGAWLIAMVLLVPLILYSCVHGH